MPRQCSKCHYVRQPTDLAPEDTCPRCGAVYAKVEAALLSGRQPPPSRSGPLPTRPVGQAVSRGTAAAMLVGVGSALLLLISVLFGTRYRDGGSLGVAITILGALLGGIGLSLVIPRGCRWLGAHLARGIGRCSRCMRAVICHPGGPRRGRMRWGLHGVGLVLLLAWPVAGLMVLFGAAASGGTVPVFPGFELQTDWLVWLTCCYPLILGADIWACAGLERRGVRPGLVAVVAMVPLLSPVPLVAAWIGLAATRPVVLSLVGASCGERSLAECATTLEVAVQRTAAVPAGGDVLLDTDIREIDYEQRALFGTGVAWQRGESVDWSLRQAGLVPHREGPYPIRITLRAVPAPEGLTWRAEVLDHGERVAWLHSRPRRGGHLERVPAGSGPDRGALRVVIDTPFWVPVTLSGLRPVKTERDKNYGLDAFHRWLRTVVRPELEVRDERRTVVRPAQLVRTEVPADRGFSHAAWDRAWGDRAVWAARCAGLLASASSQFHSANARHLEGGHLEELSFLRAPLPGPHAVRNPGARALCGADAVYVVDYDDTAFQLLVRKYSPGGELRFAVRSALPAVTISSIIPADSVRDVAGRLQFERWTYTYPLRGSVHAPDDDPYVLEHKETFEVPL